MPLTITGSEVNVVSTTFILFAYTACSDEKDVKESQKSQYLRVTRV